MTETETETEIETEITQSTIRHRVICLVSCYLSFANLAAVPLARNGISDLSHQSATPSLPCLHHTAGDSAAIHPRFLPSSVRPRWM